MCLGGLCTDSIATTPPAAVVFDVGETRAVNIQMSARYDAEGQLVAIENNLLTGNLALGTPTSASPEEPMGSITGKITSFFSSHTVEKVTENPTSENQDRAPDGLLSLSTTPDFSAPMWMPLFLDDNGRFLVDVKPGTYYIMAVVDQNRDGRSGTSDGIGIYGTHQPVRGMPAALTVFPTKPNLSLIHISEPTRPY